MRNLTSRKRRTPVAASTQTAQEMGLLRRLEKKWDEIQVGRQGSYSIERLESLSNYCKTTSRARAVLVCILTPLPALGVALLLDSLPLRPPSEGWTANWVFWIRLFLMQLVLYFAGNSQMSMFIPDLDFSPSKKLVMALGNSTAFVGVCILAAITIGFPVPLMMQFCTIPIGIFTPIALRIVFGPALFSRDSPFKLDSDRFHRLFFTIVVLIGVYPLYKVLYDFVPEAYRSIVVIILPLWKFAAKHFVLRATRNLEDYIPGLVALWVDFFSTLFMSRCMSTAGSLHLSAMFIAADIAQSILEFREVRNNALVVLQLVQDRQTSLKLVPYRNKQQISFTTDLVAILLDVTRNPRNYHVKSLPGVRLWACLPHSVTKEQLSQLEALGRSGVYVQEGLRSTKRTNRLYQQISRRPRMGRRIVVVPAPTSDLVDFTTHGVVVELSNTQYHSSGPASIEKSKRLVQQGLQLMFHSEYLVLVEYVECVVPLVFLLYVLVLNELPNAIYYPGDTKRWGAAAISNLLVLAALEVGSFWFVYQLLRQHFGFSPIYQLAFVLESQAVMVQAHLFMSTLILLQYELLHLGADFTLEFKWLHDSSQ